jgi:hypothetical protein
MKTKTVERLLNETPEEVKNDVSEYADKVAGLGGIINFNSTKTLNDVLTMKKASINYKNNEHDS